MYKKHFMEENLFLESDNLINKIMTECEIINLEKTQKLFSITEKALLDKSYDSEIVEKYLDVVSYYKEAEEGIIDKFIAWVKGIIDALLGRNEIQPQEMIPEETEVVVEGDPKGFMAFIEKIMNTVIDFIKNPVVKFAGNVIEISSIIYGGKKFIDFINDKYDEVTGRETKMKAKEVKSYIEKLNGFGTKLKTVMVDLKKKLKGTELLDGLKKGVDLATKAINFLKGKLVSAYKKTSSVFKKSNKNNKDKENKTNNEKEKDATIENIDDDF